MEEETICPMCKEETIKTCSMGYYCDNEECEFEMEIWKNVKSVIVVNKFGKTK